MIKTLLFLVALVALSYQQTAMRRLAAPVLRVTPRRLDRGRHVASHAEKWRTFFEPPFFFRNGTDALERLEDNLVLKKKLGEGMYSKVYQGIDLKTGEQVAAKMIRKDLRHPDGYFEVATMVNQEIYSQSLLPEHPTLCRFVRAFETPKNVRPADRGLHRHGGLRARDAAAALRRAPGGGRARRAADRAADAAGDRPGAPRGRVPPRH